MIAFSMYVAGLWVAVVGIATSLFVLGYTHLSASMSGQLAAVQGVVEADSSVSDVSGPTVASPWYLEDIHIVYLVFGLSIIAAGLLLMLSGHMVRSRRHELESMQGNGIDL